LKPRRWLVAIFLVALMVAGCNDKTDTSTEKTPTPAVEVAPSATTAAVLPAVQSGDTTAPLVSPLATPADAVSPLPTPAAAP
jgi:PBP1b-binding outer membrane lipoprotein LpoB